MKNRILGIVIGFLLSGQLSAQIEGIYEITDICNIYGYLNGDIEYARNDTYVSQIEIKKTPQNNQYDYMITDGTELGYYYMEVYINFINKYEFFIPEQNNSTSSFFETFGINPWAGNSLLAFIDGQGSMRNDSIFFSYQISGNEGLKECQCSGKRIGVSIPKPQIIEPKGEVVNIYDNMGRSINCKIIESLPVGMYILQYENGETEKIVKQ